MNSIPDLNQYFFLSFLLYFLSFGFVPSWLGFFGILTGKMVARLPPYGHKEIWIINTLRKRIGALLYGLFFLWVGAAYTMLMSVFFNLIYFNIGFSIVFMSIASLFISIYIYRDNLHLAEIGTPKYSIIHKIVMFILGLGLAISAGLIWAVISNQSRPIYDNEEVGWNEHINTEYGFKLRYPNYWTVNDQSYTLNNFKHPSIILEGPVRNFRIYQLGDVRYVMAIYFDRYNPRIYYGGLIQTKTLNENALKWTDVPETKIWIDMTKVNQDIYHNNTFQDDYTTAQKILRSVTIINLWPIPSPSGLNQQ